ncbi:hypothetical protein JG687_00011351 [Phytophthora cactorum]|uniref:Uncharacterized protein n=1 Tax=Phytophthora cactorum TaxID=29920 RepID=A0A329SIN4_9STRA|nr:hypothetical protein Pcac1_g15110 [Phytophthora cactorum]KAG2837383.1 hypothetical protein PC111_g4673 [Phytophthora cactorum]KAG2864236.1 hypothetical protein PC113_g4759 [Phytophthora cactorum]KAG2879475.1 hypothetical protein PC115_g22782 [Phytophthora cactorum]KAG2880714.1 hypothetical protein PC114_g21935 [Phytophthora cactorum]
MSVSKTGSNNPEEAAINSQKTKVISKETKIISQKAKKLPKNDTCLHDQPIYRWSFWF